jgi:hypothetical protein
LAGALISHEADNQCSIADYDQDGVLDFFDVANFVTDFNAGDLSTDLTGDGVLNFFDVSAFIVAYQAGCP